MGNIEQFKKIKKRLNNFIILDILCIVIVLIIASLINVDWSSIFGKAQPQISTPSTGDVFNAVGPGDIEQQLGAFTNVMSTIFGIVLSIVVMLQIFRICIDVLYIIAPAEFELLIPKQLTSDNVKHAKESKEPITEYLKLMVPALLVLFVTSAVVLFGVDNLMSAIINMLTSIIG